MADFNGDGRGDFAVLLKVYARATDENPLPKMTGLWFVVLLTDGMDVPRPASMQSLDRGLMRRIRLEPRAPGDVRVKGGTKAFKLRRPGIVRRICRKSAALFYWDRMAVRKAVIAD